MYTVNQTSEILDTIYELRERMEVSTDPTERIDLEQAVYELQMHLAEN